LYHASDFLYTIVPIFFFGYDQLLVKLQMTLEILPGNDMWITLRTMVKN